MRIKNHNIRRLTELIHTASFNNLLYPIIIFCIISQFSVMWPYRLHHIDNIIIANEAKIYDINDVTVLVVIHAERIVYTIMIRCWVNNEKDLQIEAISTSKSQTHTIFRWVLKAIQSKFMCHIIIVLKLFFFLSHIFSRWLFYPSNFSTNIGPKYNNTWNNILF